MRYAIVADSKLASAMAEAINGVSNCSPYAGATLVVVAPDAPRVDFSRGGLVRVEFISAGATPATVAALWGCKPAAAAVPDLVFAAPAVAAAAARLSLPVVPIDAAPVLVALAEHTVREFHRDVFGEADSPLNTKTPVAELARDLSIAAVQLRCPVDAVGATSAAAVERGSGETVAGAPPDAGGVVAAAPAVVRDLGGAATAQTISSAAVAIVGEMLRGPGRGGPQTYTATVVAIAADIVSIAVVAPPPPPPAGGSEAGPNPAAPSERGLIVSLDMVPGPDAAAAAGALIGADNGITLEDFATVTAAQLEVGPLRGATGGGQNKKVHFIEPYKLSWFSPFEYSAQV